MTCYCSGGHLALGEQHGNTVLSIAKRMRSRRCCRRRECRGPVVDVLSLCFLSLSVGRGF